MNTDETRLLTRTDRSRAARVTAVGGGIWYALGALFAAPSAFTAAARALPGIVVAAALYVVAAYLLAQDRDAYGQLVWDAEARRTRQSRRKNFLIVNAGQGLAALVAIAAANALHVPERIPALIVIIVGVHFVPLAAIFRTRSYFVLAAAVIAGGLASFAWSGVASETVATTSAAASLWIASAYLLGTAYRLRAERSARALR